MAPRFVLVAAVLAFALSACGEDKEEQAAARKAVSDLYTALAAKDGKGVCRGLSAEGKQAFAKATRAPGEEAQSCETLFDFALTFSEGLQNVGKADVTDVDVDGDKARAKVKFDNRNEGDVNLVKEGGRWKLNALGLK